MNKTLFGGIALLLTVTAVQGGENKDTVEKATAVKKETAVKAVGTESKAQVDSQKKTNEVKNKKKPRVSPKTTSNGGHPRHPRPGNHRHGGLSLHIRQNRYQRFLFNQLPKDEKKKLEALYKKNPSAYYKELKKIAARFRKHDVVLDKRVEKLAKQYKQEKDAAKKEKILKQITWITRRQFYFRLEETRRSLDESERKLKALKTLYNARKRNAKAIIERRINDLTGSNLDW